MKRYKIQNLCKLAVDIKKSWLLDPYHLAIRQRIPKTFPGICSNAPVLDVGCGPAPYHESIKRKEYIGLDLYVPVLPKQILFVLGDARRLPFRTALFDGVMCMAMLEHVDEDREVLREIFRVLSRDKTCLLVVPTSYYRDWNASKPSDHGYRGYSMRGCKRLLKESGFEIVNVQMFCSIPMRIYSYLMKKLVGRFFDLNEISQESVQEFLSSIQEMHGKNQTMTLVKSIQNILVRIHIFFVNVIAMLDRLFPPYCPMLYMFLCRKKVS